MTASPFATSSCSKKNCADLMNALHLSWKKQVLFWALLYLAWLLLYADGYTLRLARTATIEVCYLFFISATVYAIGGYLSRKGKDSSFLAIVAVLLGIVAASAACRMLVARAMGRYVFRTPAMPLARLYFNSLLNILFWTALVLAAKWLWERKAAEQRAHLQEKERLAAELAGLKAQVNPHMLFNALNTLYGHIEKENRPARQLLLQFASLLRYQLYECATEWVSLESEIRYLENYCDLQRARTEHLCVQRDLSPANGTLPIAPLLLIVLLENAFKYAAAADGQPFVRIELYTHEGRLHYRVVNSTDFPSNGTGSGVGGLGLANLRRRLELSYPGRHTLHTLAGDGIYQATLTVKLN